MENVEKRRWTKREIVFLIQYYPRLGQDKQILVLLPGRTIKAICGKADELGIRSNVHYERISNARYKGNTDRAGRKRAQRLFPAPKGVEHHHIDGNPLNNDPSNVLLVTRKQHMEIDGRLIENPKKRWKNKE